MEYYHVLVAVGAEKMRVVLSDADLSSLEKQFVSPYKKGAAFLLGNGIFNPAEFRVVQIIKTDQLEAVVREKLNQEDLRRIDEINRGSSGMTFLSAGTGYEPCDLADGGVDVTAKFLAAAPGSTTRLHSLSKVSVGWIFTMLGSIVVAGIVKWLGWL